MSPTITSNAREFSAAFQQYLALTSRTPAEAVVKQAQEFGNALRRRLRSLAPAKGSIRAERLAALESGEGVAVRPAIIERLMARRGVAQRIDGRGVVFGRKMSSTTRSGGKRLNFRALAIQAEINIRERGRGFVAYSAAHRPNRLKADGGTQRQEVIDRYRRFLSSLAFRRNSAGAQAVFSWGGNESSGNVARVLTGGPGQEAVAGALADARANMLAYVRRKLEQNAQATVGRMR